MSNTKALLDYRKHLKARKPAFIRQDAHKRPALGRKWRRPKGIQSKMRKHLHGYRRSVSTGYSSPRAVHSLHPSGLQGIVVKTLHELSAVNSKTQGAIIAHVGLKRKMELIQYTIDKKIPVLNVKDPAMYLKKIQEDLQKKKEQQTTKLKEKKTKENELKKVATEKAKETERKENAEAFAEEDKKKEQVKEMEKVLTKRQ